MPQNHAIAGPRQGGWLVSVMREQESASFWKKKQKLLLIGARGGSTAHLNIQKFFGSFFQKRTACLYPA
jgi:hypothetical protein